MKILHVKLKVSSEIKKKSFNPSTSMSDQDRISPPNINTMSSRQVMRIYKNISKGMIS